MQLFWSLTYWQCDRNVLWTITIFSITIKCTYLHLSSSFLLTVASATVVFLHLKVSFVLIFISVCDASICGHPDIPIYLWVCVKWHQRCITCWCTYVRLPTHVWGCQWVSLQSVSDAGFEWQKDRTESERTDSRRAEEWFWLLWPGSDAVVPGGSGT